MTSTKADRKKKMVQIIAIVVAGVMILSVILAAILAQ